MSSNQTHPWLPKPALVAACIAALPVLIVAAWLASSALPGAGEVLIVAVFGACGLTRARRQRAVKLPRPAAAPLPAREPAQLAA